MLACDPSTQEAEARPKLSETFLGIKSSQAFLASLKPVQQSVKETDGLGKGKAMKHERLGPLKF